LQQIEINFIIVIKYKKQGFDASIWTTLVTLKERAAFGPAILRRQK
jgi:hypothetical protein